MSTNETTATEPTREQRLRAQIAELEARRRGLERLDREINETRETLAYDIGKMFIVIDVPAFIRGVTSEFATDFRNMNIRGELSSNGDFWCKILVAENDRRVELWLLPGDRVRVMLQDNGRSGKLYEISAYATLAEAEAAAKLANR